MTHPLTAFIEQAAALTADEANRILEHWDTLTTPADNPAWNSLADGVAYTNATDAYEPTKTILFNINSLTRHPLYFKGASPLDLMFMATDLAIENNSNLDSLDPIDRNVLRLIALQAAEIQFVGKFIPANDYEVLIRPWSSALGYALV